MATRLDSGRLREGLSALWRERPLLSVIIAGLLCVSLVCFGAGGACLFFVLSACPC